jgi:hypothetical protein
LSRDKLFTLAARTDWPVVCCSCWGKAAGTCHCHLMCLRLLLLLCPASERRREGHAWSGEVGRECSSRWGSGCPLKILLTQPAWGPRYIASGRTQQKTPPPTVLLLLLLAVALQ